MKKLHLALPLPIAIALLFPDNAAAQARQTVEGAQQLLRNMFHSGSDVYAKYSRQDIARFDGLQATFVVDVSAMDNINTAGKDDPCVTRISGFEGRQSVYPINGRRYPASHSNVTMTRSLGEFPAPRYIDWGNVSITRTPNFVDGASRYELVLAQGNTGDGFGFNVADPAMADRIEYAMRFLQASCDASASTGF